LNDGRCLEKCDYNVYHIIIFVVGRACVGMNVYYLKQYQVGMNVYYLKQYQLAY